MQASASASEAQRSRSIERPPPHFSGTMPVCQLIINNRILRQVRARCRRQPGSCKETAMCRRADHLGVPATTHIGRGVLFRSSPKSTSPNWPGSVGIRSARPRMSGGQQANPGIWRGAPATWSVPASSSQATPVLPTAPCRPISPLQDFTSRMQRFPAASLAEQEERSSQSPADKRRQHLSEALERVRHVTAPSRAGTCRSRPVRQGSSFDEVSHFTSCFPPQTTPARRSDIRPNSPGMG
jgi:hypothetical protein